MRQPKWTHDETMAHFWWRIQGDNRQRESADDREEFEFCAEYYDNDPEVQRLNAEMTRKANEALAAMAQACRETAAATVQAGERAILESLADRTQDHWIHFFIVISHRYSRRVIDYILSEANPWLRWIVLDHPHLTIADFERISVDPECTEHTRIEARRILSVRLNSDRMVC